VGMYASIQTLQDQVDKLVLVLPYVGKELTEPTEVKEQSSKTTEDQGLLDSAIDELEGIVTIRHTELEVKEVLTPQEAQFIREQLRVKLEMVKISLVQHNEALYQSSLADAKKWTAQHFTRNTDFDNFIAELDRFSNIKIRSQFPDISSSLKMLRDITKLRIETDKAMQPAEADAPVKTINPVESIKPAETIKPPETAAPAEAVPATQK
ncbi:MAG: uroporphyrinogen-III C-methyltransferase, partial [Methylococcaceae bacterium]|nr:uroporphyrinogen-III C-methyltransferase [Methylococcaceae bacterium]